MRCPWGGVPGAVCGVPGAVFLGRCAVSLGRCAVSLGRYAVSLGWCAVSLGWYAVSLGRCPWGGVRCPWGGVPGAVSPGRCLENMASSVYSHLLLKYSLPLVTQIRQHTVMNYLFITSNPILPVSGLLAVIWQHLPAIINWYSAYCGNFHVHGAALLNIG